MLHYLGPVAELVLAGGSYPPSTWVRIPPGSPKYFVSSWTGRRKAMWIANGLLIRGQGVRLSTGSPTYKVVL